MSLDMGGHIDGTFASVPATRTTYSGGSYVEGKWSAGTGVASTHVCTIQPMSNKEIDNLDSGAERLLDVRKIYINDGTVGKLAESDTWVFSGLDGVFKTIAIDNRPWRTYAKIIVSRKDRIKVVVSFTVHPVPLELEHLPIVVNFTTHPVPLALTEEVIVNFTQHPVPLELEHFPLIDVNFTTHPLPLILEHLPIVVSFTTHPVPLELEHLPVVVNFTAHPVPLTLEEPGVIVIFTAHPTPLTLEHFPLIDVNFTQHPVPLELEHFPLTEVSFTTNPVPLSLEREVPVFSVQPENVELLFPNDATFGPVAASDVDSWEWQAEATNEAGDWSADLATIFSGRASGATTDTLLISPTEDLDDRGIRVVATNVTGSTNSNEVVLLSDPSPLITGPDGYIKGTSDTIDGLGFSALGVVFQIVGDEATAVVQGTTTQTTTAVTIPNPTNVLIEPVLLTPQNGLPYNAGITLAAGITLYALEQVATNGGEV